VSSQEVMEREVQTSPQMLSLLQSSEIDMQISTAHKFPRSIKKFRDESLQMVTLTESIATECIYALPRDGKVVEGPSARFAEIIFSAWGNARSGARTVSDEGEFVTSQGVFHDLERNTAITYEVKRRITNKSGKRFSADMIMVTANAASSIALRNAILKGIPKAFWADMYAAARKTAAGDYKTLANRRSDALKAFVIYGVKPDQIFGVLGVKGEEDITIEHLVVLKGMLTAIQEGDSSAEQMFSQEAGGKPAVAQPQRKSEAGNGASAPAEKPAEQPTGPLSESQIKLIKAKLQTANLGEADLFASFGATETGYAGIQASKVNDVLEWIKKNG
jgi:hypothetical protein